MKFIEEIIKLSHSDLSNFEVDNVDGFTCHSYLKDSQGRYISCSDEQAKAVGLHKRDDLIQLTDFDVMKPLEAANFKENDNKAIYTQKPLITLEKFTWYDGKKVEATSIKTPLRLKNSKKIMGVIGMSILKFEDETTDNNNPYTLTSRQLECLYYLTKGFSLKQISNVMQLSPRTIEHHLDAVKIKLDCRLRSDLIAKAIQLTYIRKRLLD